MFLKFSVNLLKSARPYSLCPAATAKFSTTMKNPCEKDWMLEIAGPCDTNEIVQFVSKHFFKEEPLCKALIPGKHPKVLEDEARLGAEHGMTVVARKCCPKRTIIGLSINERSGKLAGVKLAKIANEIEDSSLKKLFEVWATINLEPKINDKLCQDELFKVSILSVDEAYWGRGIGIELVQRSLDLAREKNFNYAQINCTSDNTRKIAEQLNLKRFWTAPYKDLMCQGCNKNFLSIPKPPHDNASVYYMDLKKQNC